MRLIILILGFSCFLFSLTVGKRAPGEFPFENEPNRTFIKYEISKTCPDECIYADLCGKGTPGFIEDASRVNATEEALKKEEETNKKSSWVANGNGICIPILGLDTNHCPIRSEGECLIKCGGVVCASFVRSFEVRPFNEDHLLVYRQLNDTSLNYWEESWYEKVKGNKEDDE